MTKIIIIEDNSGWLDLITRILKTSGYEINRTSNLDEALVAISSNKQKYDLIVFDLVLESTIVKDHYLWLDALVQGMKTRNIEIPPIICITGYSLSKSDLIRGFTNFRGIVYNIFEKSTWNPNAFIECVKDATSQTSIVPTKPKSFGHLLVITLLMILVVLGVFTTLLWIVGRISDPQTQQIVLSTGGALIIVITIFIVVLNQGVKIQDVIEGIAKIWRG